MLRYVTCARAFMYLCTHFATNYTLQKKMFLQINSYTGLEIKQRSLM